MTHAPLAFTGGPSILILYNGGPAITQMRWRTRTQPKETHPQSSLDRYDKGRLEGKVRRDRLMCRRRGCRKNIIRRRALQKTAEKEHKQYGGRGTQHLFIGYNYINVTHAPLTFTADPSILILYNCGPAITKMRWRTRTQPKEKHPRPSLDRSDKGRHKRKVRRDRLVWGEGVHGK